jgi:hypothetical protein
MTLINNTPVLYAGMNCSGIEIFAVESEMKFIADKQIQSIINLPYGIRQLTQEEIEKDATVKEALIKMHPNSVFDQQNQFLQCRYGGLDFSADIKGNKFQEGDYWDCPNRATCPFNGVICKQPTYKGQKLSSIDILLMKQLSTNATNEVIADKLNLALGSFHKLKKALYKKLGNIQTKQENALIAKSLNLI